MATISATSGNFTYKKLSRIPALGDEYRNAMKDLVPGLATSRKVGTPSTAFEVEDVTVDLANFANYCRACRLRVSNELPLTYPYAVTFPLMMKVMTAPDFPFKAVGTVHLRNTIEQTRPLTVDESFTVRVHPENVRRHKKGLLVDLVTEISVSGSSDIVWKQTATMLSLGKYSDDTAPLENHQGLELDVPTDPTATVKVTPSDIKNYAEVSGDKNPIHVSKIGAKAFGFPKTIAHGMWTAASLLAAVEGSLPSAVRYTVEFGKPVFLPATLSLFSAHHVNRWDLQYTSAKDSSKVNVSATVEAL